MSGSSQAMQPCEPPEIDNFELVFKGEPISSVVLHEEFQKIKAEVKAKGDEWTDELIKGWVGMPTTTKFKILDVYKGNDQEEIEIYHGSKSVLGMDFLKGYKYLIYTQHQDKDQNKRYIVYHCDFGIIDEANPSDIYVRARDYKAKAH